MEIPFISLLSFKLLFTQYYVTVCYRTRQVVFVWKAKITQKETNLPLHSIVRLPSVCLNHSISDPACYLSVHTDRNNRWKKYNL